MCACCLVVWIWKQPFSSSPYPPFSPSLLPLKHLPVIFPDADTELRIRGKKVQSLVVVLLGIDRYFFGNRSFRMEKCRAQDISAEKYVILMRNIVAKSGVCASVSL